MPDRHEFVRRGNGSCTKLIVPIALRCQLAFDSTQFDTLIPWLDEHRGGLNILVHGVTGNDLADHTANASWLGEPATLNLSMFGG